MVRIKKVIEEAFNKEASDVHFVAGMCAFFRVHGELHSSNTIIVENDILSFVKEECSCFDSGFEKEEDFSLYHDGVRLRVHVYLQRGLLALAIRILPKDIPFPDELGLPAILLQFIQKKNGLFLVTGPTGSGKSTTIASLIHYLNQTKKMHIVTLENPVEYIHIPNKSLISQREVGRDTISFKEGVRTALRQDPDLIMIGELRDEDTISAAIRAAEAGRIILGTLHTHRAVYAIQRLIEGFGEDRQVLIRAQLAASLLGVASQRLVRKKELNKREAVFEVLVNTPAVANLIRSSQLHQIESMMQTGSTYGMQIFQNDGAFRDEFME